MRGSRIRIELERAIYFAPAAFYVPIEDAFRVSEPDMAVGKLFIQLDCLQGRHLHLGKRIHWFYIGIREPIPRFGDTSIGFRGIWIFFERPLEELKALPQPFLGALVREENALQIKLVGL